MKPSSTLLKYVRLNPGQINKLIESKWTVDSEGFISKKLAFKTHTDAAQFVSKIAVVADSINHHPDVHITYRWATFRLRTNDIQALTEHDASLASEIDNLHKS